MLPAPQQPSVKQRLFAGQSALVVQGVAPVQVAAKHAVPPPAVAAQRQNSAHATTLSQAVEVPPQMPPETAMP